MSYSNNIICNIYYFLNKKLKQQIIKIEYYRRFYGEKMKKNLIGISIFILIFIFVGLSVIPLESLTNYD